MNTKEKIAAKALELFNSQGIEYVGMRELAASLDTKLGNITYYFPTKEDLVMDIAASLSEQNAAILQVSDDLSLTSYLEMARRHFECQYQYRCLFLSFVHLIKQYERFSVRYKKVEEQRKKTALDSIEGLISKGYLKSLSETEKKFLLSSITLISRFWISEAAISHTRLKPQEQISHYLGLLAATLWTYATAKGKHQAGEFME